MPNGVHCGLLGTNSGMELGCFIAYIFPSGQRFLGDTGPIGRLTATWRIPGDLELKMKCAFIVSPSYSGSTLLSILLAHHPGLVTLGEFLDNEKRRFREGDGDFCSCGKKLAECPFMEDFATAVRAKGIDFSVDYPDTAFWCGSGFQLKILRAYVRSRPFETVRHAAIRCLPPVRSTVSRIVDRNTKAIGALLERTGASVYLDSAKNNNRVIYFDRYAPDIEVKVVWLIRDGRGVVTSIMRHEDCDLPTAIVRWRTTQISVMRTVGMIDESCVLRLPYEDLCTKPGPVLEDVCRFLELDPGQMPENFGGQELHLTGNNMRLKGLKEIRVDERWVSTLTPDDLRLFDREVGDLNRTLGYTS